ncbi:MAG: DUF3300 domain-containing protein [Thermoanaerobaculia bacterium]|jgi:hypothetical protein
MNNSRSQSNRLPALLAVALFAIVGTSAFAVDPAPAAAAAPAAKPFKTEELASLLAPIALYPDEIVAQVLMAATYPLEIVEANRWVEKNKTLKGEALAKEAQKQGWDQSVQAMTAIPDVLKMMDEKLDWTQKVGDAMLAQQKDVMDMVQELRAKAKAEGNLKSDDHMKVTTEPPPADAAATETKTEVIVIESASPEVIYVPTYNPVTVYGYWGYPAYPPYYYPPPIGYPGSGFWWGVGVGISIGFWGGAWNNNCNWHGGDIDINTGDINIDRGDRNTNINSGNRGDTKAGTDRAGTNKSGSGKSWSHNPEHRKGASYRDSSTAQKYNRPSTSNASAGSRDAYRGRSDSGASAGTRDLSGGSRSGTSAGTRELSGGGGASAGTSNLGSTGTRELGRGMDSGSTRSSSPSTSSRGTSSSRGSSSSAFGGMSSGSRASSYSSRGGASRGGGGGRGGRR